MAWVGGGWRPHSLALSRGEPPPPPRSGRPKLTGRRAQQGGQQCQAEALHGSRQHAPGGPPEGTGAGGAGPLGRAPGREKPRSADAAPRPARRTLSFPGLRKQPPPGNPPPGSPGSSKAPTPSPSPRAPTTTPCPPGKTGPPSGRRRAGTHPPHAQHPRDKGCRAHLLLLLGERQVCPERKGQGKVREKRTCCGGRGARHVSTPHPWAGGPGTPRGAASRAHASALTEGQRVECRPRVRGRGAALTSLGCRRSDAQDGAGGTSGAESGVLRSPCGAEPGGSLFVFRGTQPQTRTPSEGRGGAGPGARRGGGGGRPAAGAPGALRSEPGLCPVPPGARLAPARPRVRPLNSRSLHGLRLPLPRRGRHPFPLWLAESPLEFLGRTFTVKGSETHKDAGRERGSEQRYWREVPVHGAAAVPLPAPDRSGLLPGASPRPPPAAAANPSPHILGRTSRPSGCGRSFVSAPPAAPPPPPPRF